MKIHAILSALGSDRIGVADDLAAALSTRRIDVEDSRMAALGGRFTIIAQVSGEENDVARLQQELPGLAAGLKVHMSVVATEDGRRPQAAQRYRIESYSTGPSGIMALTGLLKQYGVNIENLKTDADASSFSRETAFHMRGNIAIPPDCAVEKLKQALREVERERDVDIIIKPRLSAARTAPKETVG